MHKFIKNIENIISQDFCDNIMKDSWDWQSSTFANNNENIAYFDGNVKIIGELQIDNINTNNTLSIKNRIHITDNVISLGDYVETSTNKNKITAIKYLYIN